MTKSFKDNIRFIMAVVSVLIIVGLIWISIYSLLPPDKKKIERYFNEDKANLALVTEYLINLDSSYIIIDETDFNSGILLVGTSVLQTKIEDETVIKAIGRLLNEEDYSKIVKANKTVYFQKWSMLEEHRGIAYSVDKDEKPVIEFLIEAQPISETGWYYYVSDYNEWRG